MPVDCSLVDLQGFCAAPVDPPGARCRAAPRPRGRLAAALGASLLLASTPARANLHLADAEVASASVAAVHGVVLAVTPVADASVGAIYTIVSLHVVRSWGLPDAPPVLDLKLLGGALASRALRVPAQATFARGEEVFAFLEVRPRDRTFAVTALGRGKWTIARPSATDVLATRIDNGHDSGHRVTRTLAELEALATLAGTRLHAPADARRDVHTLWVPTNDQAAALAATEGRWHRTDWNGPVPVDAAGLTTAAASTPVVTALTRALGAWSSASALALVPGALTAPRCFAGAVPDGRIVVTFGDPCDEIPDTSPVLAFAAAFLDESDVRVVNGVPYSGITAGLVVVDDAPAKIDRLGAACLEELFTHELGHTLGLAHTTDPASVMHPALPAACDVSASARPLSAFDRATLQARYPMVTSGGPPGRPVGVMAAVYGRDVRVRWRGAAGADATSYRLLAGSAPGESDLGMLAVDGTGIDVSGVAPGVYYLRVVAVNAGGASAPSTEITVVVGDDVPSAPTGLLAAADTTGRVRLYWQRPAGAAKVTGYVLLVRSPVDNRLLRVPVASTSLSAEGVAPGAYPVRVAAVTAAGPGPASAEILVVVP